MYQPHDGNVFFAGFLLRASLRDYSNPEFIFQTTLTQKYKYFIKVMSPRSGQPGINASEIEKFPIYLPKLLEQNRVATFFSLLDQTIVLHQRKISYLVSIKQAFLMKIFTKVGTIVPEIRFKGFTTDWEQSKLGDLFYERTEKSSEGELISVTINSGVLKASDLDRKDNSSKNKSNYKVVYVGDIAYNSMRMWQGASGYSPYNGILSPAYTVIVPKSNADSKFFAFYFKKHDMIHTFKSNSQGLTSDTWNLKFPTLKSINVKFPNKLEQSKLSNFMGKIDEIIELEHYKITTINKLKKVYLEKLFL